MKETSDTFYPAVLHINTKFFNKVEYQLYKNHVEPKIWTYESMYIWSYHAVSRREAPIDLPSRGTLLDDVEEWE